MEELGSVRAAHPYFSLTLFSPHELCSKFLHFFLPMLSMEMEEFVASDEEEPTTFRICGRSD